MGQRYCEACTDNRFDECRERASLTCKRCGCALSYSCVEQDHYAPWCEGCIGPPYCGCEQRHTGMCADVKGSSDA